MAENKKKVSKKGGKSVKILDVGLNSTSVSSLLARITQRIKTGQKTFIVTPNPEFLVLAQSQPWFKAILNQADMAIPDGIGLVWASRFLVRCNPFEGYTLKDLKERISGTDLMEKLCQEAAERDWSVYLLGGEPGVAKKTLAVLKRRYPSLKGWAEAGPVLEMRSGKWAVRCQRLCRRREVGREVGSGKWEKEHLGGGQRKDTSEVGAQSPSSEVEKWVKKINHHRPHLLFVALGMGKQEKFIWDNWDQLKVKFAMGVGGAFDYISGKVPRAPVWMREAGLEWLYRLIREPWRWRRQLALAEFIWLILKEKNSPNPKKY